MALFVYQQSAFIENEGVQIAPYAAIVVTNSADDSAATIYEDSAGATPITGGSFVADENGFFRFYANYGLYDIAITSGSITKSLLNVSIGKDENLELLNWAYVQAFAITSATRNSNNVITTASITWPDGATGTFTTDTINTTFNAIDAWHATHTLSAVTKTVTQTAVTRNTSGAVITQPVITIS
jgi:hypothetical protein